MASLSIVTWKVSRGVTEQGFLSEFEDLGCRSFTIEESLICVCVKFGWRVIKIVGCVVSRMSREIELSRCLTSL